MSPLSLSTIVVSSFIILMFTGLPVAFCLIGLSVMIATILIDPGMLYIAYSNAFSAVTKDIYIATPLFIFMATVLQYSGIGSRMYATMYKCFSGLRGGLAIGTVAMCTLIAAMTGVASTGVVTIGILAYPEMEKRGYNKGISLGCIAAGSSLGPLIPPSVMMVIIGGFASLSVGKLFLGGVFPGLLMSFFFMAYVAVRCFLEPNLGPAVPFAERVGWRDKLRSLSGLIGPIGVIFSVLGTIYFGVCTPTEAGGIGAFGALVCAACYGQLDWEMLKKAAYLALRVDCMVMWLLIGGSCFSSLLVTGGLADFLSSSITDMAMSPMAVLATMMFIVFVMGMLMDGVAITMVTIPVFMPIIMRLGIDPLWFALLFTITIIIGFVTPPFGLCLFYTKGIVPPNVTMMDIYRASIPYVILMLLVLIAGILFPPLLTWLPQLIK